MSLSIAVSSNRIDDEVVLFVDDAHPVASEDGNADNPDILLTQDNNAPGPPDQFDAIKAKAAELLPHRGTYAISLKQAFDPEVADVSGTMTVQILATEGGWTFEERIVLVVYDTEGNAENFLITTASWEAVNGLKYRFYTQIARNDEPVQVIHGDAFKSSPQGTGTVHYQQPAALTVYLPARTLFPLQYTMQLMQTALAGPLMDHATVFDGASESQQVVYINTAITSIANPNVKFSEAVPFSTAQAWAMHMAVYSNNVAADPDYEMTQNMLPQGIVASAERHFGSFSAKLVLTELQLFNSKSRKSPKNLSPAKPRRTKLRKGQRN